MADPSPAAPAQPISETPPIVTAVDQTVADADMSAFRSARAAERQGKPFAAPTPPVVTPEPDDAPDDDLIAATPAAITPPRTISKRQQQINDYERTIADQKLRIARLEGESAARRPEPVAAAPAPASTVPDYERYAAMVDAPQEDAFETYSKYTTALALFIADKRYDEREQQRTTREQQTQQQQALSARDMKFRERIAAATAADPTFAASLSDTVTALAPIDAVVAAGQPATSLNALATEFLEHDLGPQFMRHFSAHPEELQRFAHLTPRAFLYELGKLEVTLTAAPAPRADPPKTISTAPAPPPTLGSRPADTANPIESAVASGDQSAFKAAKLAQRMALQR